MSFVPVHVLDGQEAQMFSKELMNEIDLLSVDLPIIKKMHSNSLDNQKLDQECIQEILGKLEYSNAGRLKPSLKNAMTILELYPEFINVFSFNERSLTIMVTRQPGFIPCNNRRFPDEFHDADATNIALAMDEIFDVEFPLKKLFSVIELSAKQNSYDPVKDILESLVWDKIDRVDTWLSTYLGAANDEYSKLIGRKWLIAAVARTYEPGCKADNVLVLEGPQGSGKSTALEVLGLGYHGGDLPAFHTKDAQEYLAGLWIVEIAELEGMNKSTIGSVKTFLTTARDRYRKSYGRLTNTIPRRVIFAASTNENTYLTDPTGNRRFWPVRTMAIDLAALRNDVRLLWAEAVHLYKSKMPWFLETKEEYLLVEESLAERVVSDPWRSTIEQCLNNEKNITIDDLVQALGIKLEKRSNRDSRRINSIAQSLGYERIQVRCGSQNKRVFRKQF